MENNEFRAWNKEKEIMVYDNEDDSAEYWDGTYKSDISMINSILGEDHWNSGVYDFMRYKHLRDKNGQMIYDGDILSYKKIIYTDCSMEEIEEILDESFIGILTYRLIASVVKPYSKNVACFGYDNENDECLILDLQSKELEIVGNIYENKNLLKEIENEK